MESFKRAKLTYLLQQKNAKTLPPTKSSFFSVFVFRLTLLIRFLTFIKETLQLHVNRQPHIPNPTSSSSNSSLSHHHTSTINPQYFLQHISKFSTMSSDGTLLKPEKDYTETLDKQLPEIESLAKVTNSLNRKATSD